MLFFKVDIPCSGKNMQSRVGLQHGQLHDVAELVYVYHEPMTETTTGTDLQEVHGLVIDLLDKLLWRVVVQDAFFGFGLICVVV